MDDKYVIPKAKKAETRAEILQQKMEELVKQRDRASSPAEKRALNAQLTKLFAQYEGLRL